MAAANDDACLKMVLAHEGGYSNHPSDPGGPTNFGITLADFRRYVKANATAADVKAMTLAQAAPIYRAHYWDALRCDDLPSGLDYALFDYGVNSGVARAAKVIRRIVGAPDGAAIDAAVLASVARADAAMLVKAVCDERLAFLKSLKTWPVFGLGWGRRVAEVRASALALAAAIPFVAGPAIAKPAVKTVRPVAKRVASAATAVVVAAGAAVTQQTSQSGHGAGLIALAVLLVVAAVLAGVAALVFWKWRHAQTAVAIAKETSHGME